MATQARAAAEPRVRMSRERVLEAAMHLVDAGGIGALTMRRLAQELGVEAMTLYYYVANKQEILKGLVDIVVDEIDLPEPGVADWKAALRRAAISAHETLERHPWAASLILSEGDTVSRMRYMNSILGTFREAGFSADLTDHAYHALESHIMGFTLWTGGMNLGPPEEARALATAFLERLPEGDYPHLVEHVHVHLKPRRSDDEGSFAFGLDLLLDGMERALNAERRRHARQL